MSNNTMRYIIFFICLFLFTKWVVKVNSYTSSRRKWFITTFVLSFNTAFSQEGLMSAFDQTETNSTYLRYAISKFRI